MVRGLRLRTFGLGLGHMGVGLRTCVSGLWVYGGRGIAFKFGV